MKIEKQQWERYCENKAFLKKINFKIIKGKKQYNENYKPDREPTYWWNLSWSVNDALNGVRRYRESLNAPVQNFSAIEKFGVTKAVTFGEQFGFNLQGIARTPTPSKWLLKHGPYYYEVFDSKDRRQLYKEADKRPPCFVRTAKLVEEDEEGEVRVYKVTYYRDRHPEPYAGYISTYHGRVSLGKTKNGTKRGVNKQILNRIFKAIES